ncbi:HAD-like domain-containing protein [Russula earlei]|uniref:HAD-like domain-containing protein n=1 Tax=Russula earlei TaxID=71964 RepID=A0ACC0U2T4_9AGAM|nr:HAD-like domain-containing protein [Russula earlei]
MPSHKIIEYVIFDMDGLIIDSERVYTDVTNDILAPYGAEMTWDIKAGLMGKPDRAAAAHLLSHFPDIPLTIDDYLARRTAEQDARWPHVQLLPGVARLVAHLAAHGVPIGIATGSVRQRHMFAHFGSNVVCGDDAAGRGKPFPDGLLAAARMLGRAVGPNEEGGIVAEAEREVRARGLVFEDAVPGVQAGKRAGMSVVWVPDENLLSIRPSLAIEKPDRILCSLEDFIPEEWGLSPFDAIPIGQQN